VGSSRKILQNLAPCRILGGATAEALVIDDQIEESGRKLLKQLLVFFRAGNGLIEAEIDFIGGVDSAFLSRPEEFQSQVHR
jgi:hypothetical protein